MFILLIIHFIYPFTSTTVHQNSPPIQFRQARSIRVHQIRTTPTIPSVLSLDGAKLLWERCWLPEYWKEINLANSMYPLVSEATAEPWDTDTTSHEEVIGSTEPMPFATESDVQTTKRNERGTSSMQQHAVSSGRAIGALG